MISYSTGTSGSDADVDKVFHSLALADAKLPDRLIDGLCNNDATSVESVVAGRANVFHFPRI
jgi:phosphotransacetylase